VNRKLRIPWGRLDLLSKYQASLDNQLYKALKALREAREWRVQSGVIDGVASTETVDDSQVA